MSSFRTEWENFHIITGDSKSPANVRKINFFYVLFNKNSNKTCFKGLNSIISTRNLMRKDALDPHNFIIIFTFEQLTVNGGISDVNRFQYRLISSTFFSLVLRAFRTFIDLSNR